MLHNVKQTHCQYFLIIGITVLPVVKEKIALNYVAELCSQSIRHVHYKKSCSLCLFCNEKKYAYELLKHLFPASLTA